MLQFLIDHILTLVGIVAAYFAISLFSSYQQRHGRWLGRGHSATISWLGTYSEAFQRALSLLPEIDAEVINADPNAGVIIASNNGSIRSFGTSIRIDFVTQEGVTFVQLRAGPSAQPVDWGLSRALLNRFLQIWDRLPSPSPLERRV